MLIDALKSWHYFLNHPINQGHRTRTLRDMIGWQVGSRLLPGDVIYPWIGDARFIVRPGERGLTGNVYTGLHDYEDMAYVLHALRPGDLFVDVGANAGSYTLLASAVVGAATIAFEPVPETYERLCGNVQLNHIDNLVHCVSSAVGAEEGKVSFTTGDGPMNHDVSETEGRQHTVIVPMTTLDEALERSQPSLLKIDVEGYEPDVLAGAEHTLLKPSLNSILFEDNGTSGRYASKASPRSTLHDAGFREYTYDPVSRTLTTARGTRSRCDNVLMIRDIDMARQAVTEAPYREIKEQRM